MNRGYASLHLNEVFHEQVVLLVLLSELLDNVCRDVHHGDRAAVNAALEEPLQWHRAALLVLRLPSEEALVADHLLLEQAAVGADDLFELAQPFLALFVALQQPSLEPHQRLQLY